MSLNFDVFKQILKTLPAEPNAIKYSQDNFVTGEPPEPQVIEMSVEFCGGGDAAVQRVQKQFDLPLPPELMQYLKEFAPPYEVGLNGGPEGHRIVGFESMSLKALGYSFSPDIENGELFETWDPNHLIIGESRSGTCFFVNILVQELASKVWIWMEGETFDEPVTDSIAEFISALYLQGLHDSYSVDLDWYTEQLEKWNFGKLAKDYWLMMNSD